MKDKKGCENNVVDHCRDLDHDSGTTIQKGKKLKLEKMSHTHSLFWKTMEKLKWDKTSVRNRI